MNRQEENREMNEWDEKKIDEELNALLNEIPEQDELERRINQSINKRIRKTVIHTLIGWIVIVLVMTILIKPWLNYMFYDPYKLTYQADQKILKVLRDYCETFHPYREAVSLEVRRNGIGKYKLELEVADLTKPLNSSEAKVLFDMNYSFFGDIVDSESVLSFYSDRFNQINIDKEEIIEKISELPKSAVVYLSVSELEAKSIEVLRNMEVELQWFQVYQPNIKLQGGMNYQPRMIFDEYDNRTEMTEQELLEVYVENLYDLEWEVEAWTGFGLDIENETGVTFFKFFDDSVTELRRDAGELTALLSENYCVYGKRDEIIQFLQENTFDSILIENVNLW